MALISCKECAHQVSSEANKCPSCGVSLSKKGGCSKGCLWVFVGFFALMILASLFGTDSKPNDPSKMTSSERKEKIEELNTELASVAENNYSEKSSIFTKLSELDTPNMQYKSKVEYYKKLDDKEKKKEADYVAKFGEKPFKTVVKMYLRDRAKNPDSIKYDSWSEFFQSPDGWVVQVDWRAENSFGGYVRSVNWFVIRNGFVIAMKPGNAYK